MPTSAPSAASDTTLRSLEPTAVLLDLDGTISDSGPVITRSIAETLARFGYPAQTPEQLLRFVGPPIRAGFKALANVPESQVEEVVGDYRDRYNRRMLDAPIFEGMPELIADLHARGLPIALATSKRQSMAKIILDDADLTRYFTTVHGASEDESRAVKADIVEDAVAGLRAAGADLTRAIMVGDRHHDVDGATTHGLPVILVTWGYAEPGEEDGATAVATTMDELAALLA